MTELTKFQNYADEIVKSLEEYDNYKPYDDILIKKLELLFNGMQEVSAILEKDGVTVNQTRNKDKLPYPTRHVLYNTFVDLLKMYTKVLNDLALTPADRRRNKIEAKRVASKLSQIKGARDE